MLETSRDKMLKKNKQKHGHDQKTIDDPDKFSLSCQYRHNIQKTKILSQLTALDRGKEYCQKCLEEYFS